ncbi:MAG: TA system VapC family ribonuclease toxin [Terriglobales bacterium]
MILIDANILLYAHDRTASKHEAARRWVEEAVAKREELAFAWVTLLAFLRLSTNPRVYPRALSMREALEILDAYLSRSHVLRLDPTANHWKLLRDLCHSSQITSRLVTDAHLAALAIEHGAALCTTDRDFTRFDGLKTIDPLAA